MKSTMSEGVAKLQREVSELALKFPSLRAADQQFVAWFIRAYLADNDADAVDAVSGGAGDKGIDGVYVDTRARVAYLVQAKYRAETPTKSEPRAGIMEFAALPAILSGPADEFRRYLDGMEALAEQQLQKVRNVIVRKDPYRLRLLFVTLRKVSSRHQEDARQLIRRAPVDAHIEFFDGNRTLVLLQDYLDGAAPPIPTLDLELEGDGKVSVNGVLQRYDPSNELESWVVSMRGDAIAQLFARGQRRLFARNIRGFLGGGTSINKSMAATLATEPDHFFYYNNGVTIICDSAQKVSHRGKDVLRVSNPQIINGQQTTRMLSENPARAAKASVLVKVIQVPRELGESPRFENLISKVVRATNWQNAIRPSDLMANDRRQIDLERELRRYDYAYLRKRQTKREARQSIGSNRFALVTKEEVALAVAGCDLDPVVARSGRDNLFTEAHYDQVFPAGKDALFYLPRLQLSKLVTSGARGYPQRGYAKWLVLGFIWNHLGITRKSQQRRFIELHNESAEFVSGLERVIDQAFRGALQYYNANKGRGARAVDVSLFFRAKKNRHVEFQDFWEKRVATKTRRSFARTLDSLGEQLSSE